MADYIDGFVLPIPREHLPAYQRMAQSVAEVWKEHGALDYREYVGDDLHLQGTRAFTDLAGASDHEVVVFGWVSFASREDRDLANQRVAADPRMQALVDSEKTGFDAGRMGYGGFRILAG